jgi:hypothetical protein
MENPLPGMSDPYESVVERRIREAAERGEFDDLPGEGKPLPDAGRPYDELWWVKAWLERNKLERNKPDPE